jgi:hypothetical protein
MPGAGAVFRGINNRGRLASLRLDSNSGGQDHHSVSRSVGISGLNRATSAEIFHQHDV